MDLSILIIWTTLFVVLGVSVDFQKTLYFSKFHFQKYVEVPVGVISVNSVTDLRQNIFCPFLPKWGKKQNKTFKIKY